jgi:predicted nucleic acid-binding protein
VTFCLDTSALLAHYRDEAGGDRVQEIMDGARVFVVSITITEFSRRMLALGSPVDEIERVLSDYRLMFASVATIDEKAAVRAFEISSRASGRIPLADTLIAAAASLSGSVLVHRDPHFSTIPAELLAQEML